MAEITTSCKHYDPWRQAVHPLNTDECWFFVPQSERCDCSISPHHNQACPWAGNPAPEV